MPRHDWPQESQCNDPSDPTSAEIFRRFQAMVKSGTFLGQISTTYHKPQKAEDKPEPSLALPKAPEMTAKTNELDKKGQPCYHIDMTQPDSIFSHADTPVKPDYLHRIAAERAGISDELVFRDDAEKQVYDPKC